MWWPPLPADVAGLPPLPRTFHETLDLGLVDIGLSLPDSARAAIDAYVRLLLAWTQAINLTAIRQPAAVAREHILDSLAAVPLLKAASLDDLIDLGSGGGVPGIPIAIAMPRAHMLLVESIAKKARFLETAVTTLGLGDRVRVAAERAEAFAVAGRERERANGVLVRAVAGLGEIVELSLPLLAVGGSMVAWKREPLAAELARAGPTIAALHGDRPEIHRVPVHGLEDHRLVVVRKLWPTPAWYPRPPAERRGARRREAQRRRSDASAVDH
ncbi:MAG TPA: 16S rRNA (guanine(527)-N(7))-methyltransferase RsmG [Candidatus Saccharimonadales bacterium]|nr:16S rRNA (guanine(527)-N(7))-methyltransferase RsmG [Candidatus Saccharimonadales bacterium]